MFWCGDYLKGPSAPIAAPIMNICMKGKAMAGCASIAAFTHPMIIMKKVD